LAAGLLLLLALSAAPAAVRAIGELSNGTVTPGSGTTETTFTFRVDYVATGSPSQPAQTVTAQAGSVTVPMVKVAGTAHDGTWQGSASLPAGAWAVTFFATTSAVEQPAPLLGPIVIVSAPPTPDPTSSPTPSPPTTSTPRPTAGPTAPPPPPPPPGATPVPPPRAPQPSGSAPDDGPSGTQPADASATAGGSASPSEAPDLTDDPATPEPTDVAAEGAPDTDGGSMLASFLVVGSTMSFVGAAVLVRQWYMTRIARPR
jgi:hypothetical protein